MWWSFAGGVVVGGLLVYAYYRWFSKVYSVGSELITRAEGNVSKALAHIRKLV